MSIRIHAISAPSAGLALVRNTGMYEVFYVYGIPEADQHADVAYTRERLGWTPQYDFSRLTAR